MTGQLGTLQSLLGQIELGTTGTSSNIHYQYPSDTLTFSEINSPNQVSTINFGDNLTVVATPTYNKSVHFSLSDSFSFTDSDAATRVDPLFDTLTLTDSVSYFIAYKLSPDYLTFGDGVSIKQITYWSIADQLVLYDAISVEMFYRRLLSETMTFSDAILGKESLPLVPDRLTLSDTMTGVESSGMLDTMTFSDTETFNRSFYVSLSTDVLSLRDTISSQLTNGLSFSDSLSLVDSAKIGFIHTGTVTSSLSFSEVMVREVVEKIIDDTMVFSDTLSAHHISIDTLSDTIVFSDSFGRVLYGNRVLQDYLVYNDGFAVKEFGTPNSGTGIHPSLPLTGSPVYQPMPIPVGVLSVQRSVTIQGLGTAIVLPTPEFNDHFSNQSKVVVQRSMNGLFRVYVKRTERQKVNWRFIIPKYKADELRAFILAEINNPLVAVDWEGNVWNFKLLTDSIDIVESGRWGGPIVAGDKNEVTLEFTGTKYA